jgi:hypothetical protein
MVSVVHATVGILRQAAAAGREGGLASAPEPDSAGSDRGIRTGPPVVLGFQTGAVRLSESG